ncbi:hypothetical protein GT755_12250 [Herbidospora sp. NEAU-GS84]|uniref:Uncharacterized protein n=1 Tax=Herbidospora solisilvae TaxID=2696284 RepID=A0A7C9N6R0_9ACTN|nr:hypothetical protein [Herbidospora solisilvae]NAS22453.1 hypothetical protein [Herbidospora solisilvae]
MSETYTDPGHPGVWPGGEDEATRELYDQYLRDHPIPQQPVFSRAAILARGGGRRG